MALWDTPLPPAEPPLSRDELISRIGAALADNNVQGISAEDVRSRLIEIVDSTQRVGEADSGITPEHYGAIGDGDPANMAADTHGWQAAIDASAETGVPVTPGPNTYMIDAYKGDNAVWQSGEWKEGGLIVRPGARILGSGPRTVLKNGADLWRTVVNIHEGPVSIRDLTVDGDIDNRLTCLASDEEHPTGPTRNPGGGGTGILLSLIGDNIIPYFELLNLYVKNTGGYGIGIENAYVTGGLIDSIFFSNIGADCIDVKSYPKEPLHGWKEGIHIRNAHTLDGCGHHYLGKYTPDRGETGGKNCFDLAEGCYLHGAFISGLECFGNKTSVCGVHFRPATTPGRTGSINASASLVRVASTMVPGTGAVDTQEVVGISIENDSAHLSDAVVDGGWIGLSIGHPPDFTTDSGSVVDVTIKNTTGSGDATTRDGFGLFMGAVHGMQMRNIRIISCDNGARITGGDCDMDLYIEDSKHVQLDISDNLLAQNKFKLNFKRNNRVPSIGDFDPLIAPIAATSQIAGVSPIAYISDGEMEIVQARRAYLNLIATADDSAWTGDDPFTGNRILGGVQVWGGDISGFGAGIKAAARVKADGSSGATCYWEFTTASASDHDIPAFRMLQAKNQSMLPLMLAVYTIATLPAAADFTDCIAHISNGASNKRVVVSDGTIWRYMDGTAV